MMFKFGVLLTVLFVILKILGIVTFSWWWVFSPIPIALGLALAIMFAIPICLAAVGIVLTAIAAAGYGIYKGVGAIANAFRRRK